MSSDGAEARHRLRECEGLVDALLHALQSAVGKKDMDNKVRSGAAIHGQFYRKNTSERFCSSSSSPSPWRTAFVS